MFIPFFFRLLPLLIPLFFPGRISAAEISLDLKVASVDRLITAIVSNRSDQTVQIENFQIELNRQRYAVATFDSIAAHTERSYQITVAMPELPGSYLIHSRLHYRNENQRVSLQNAAVFYVGQPFSLPGGCRIEETTLKKNRQQFRLKADDQFDWRLFLPDEIDVQQRVYANNEHIFSLRSKNFGLVNRYTIYAGAERAVNGIHQAALCSAPLTDDGLSGHYSRGAIPDPILFWITFLSGLGVSLIGIRARVNSSQQNKLNAAGCYLSRLCLIGFAYIVLRHAPVWLDDITAGLSIQSSWLTLFSDHFGGDSYRFFFEYFADAYFLAYLIAGVLYFGFFSKNVDYQADKYVALLTGVFSLYKLLLLKRPTWNEKSRLGLLTIMVKLFFLPYMASWGIQNIKHINYLLHGHLTGFNMINDLMQTVFMLADTGIFAFGYLIESRRLGSEIKSVDPYITGWLFCLWCYPPFNSFSFRYFDYAVLPIYISTTPFFQTVMSAVVTALWGVFCIASFNLGYKASNLTNRGIVRHGLYRYVRHPAYACKILAWLIQGIFLGQFTSGILLAFITVYGLRTLTEERHLSLDPAYLSYKQQVPWRFIPRVW